MQKNNGKMDCPSRNVDVLVIGAGVSGIGMACTMRRQFPHLTFTVVERQARNGGTWNLFKYPGIRSDSPMQCFSYSFHPWTEPGIMVPASDILSYQRSVMKKYNLDDSVLAYNTQIKSLNFNSETARWTATTSDDEVTFSSKYIFMGTGYYDQDKGYFPEFKGIHEFRGSVIQPMQWPKNLSLEGKDVVIIGSGATAMTIAPSICDTAKSVHILQRSPTYVVREPRAIKLSWWIEQVFYYVPSLQSLFNYCFRKFKILETEFYYLLAQRYPNFMKRVVLEDAEAVLGEDIVREHFTPTYNVWDQRVCVAPDGDMFDAIKAGKISMKTDHIDTFTESGIRLVSGDELQADVVISATGLILKLMGNIDVFVDGKLFLIHDSIMFRGCMFSGLPNLFYGMGSTVETWTVKIEFVYSLVGDVIKYMEKKRFKLFVVNKGVDDIVEDKQLPISSGYFTRGQKQLPRIATTAPFNFVGYVLWDYWNKFWNPVSNDTSLTYES
eukprot:CFRG6626T1